jgi:hypothetical protein
MLWFGLNTSICSQLGFLVEGEGSCATGTRVKIGRIMPKRAVVVLAALLCGLPTHLQSTGQQTKQGATTAPAMPSQAEIDELLDRASEYVTTYREAFTYAKASLAKAPTPGFYEKAMEECAQASQVIAAIEKNGASGVALLGIIVSATRTTVQDVSTE